MGSTTFLSPSPSQPNSEKCHFSPYFSLPIFHPPCFHSNQTYPKETHAKKTDDLLNEINKKLDLMKLESQKDMEPLKNKKYDVKYDMKN